MQDKQRAKDKDKTLWFIICMFIMHSFLFFSFSPSWTFFFCPGESESAENKGPLCKWHTRKETGDKGRGNKGERKGKKRKNIFKTHMKKYVCCIRHRLPNISLSNDWLNGRTRSKTSPNHNIIPPNTFWFCSSLLHLWVAGDSSSPKVLIPSSASVLYSHWLRFRVLTVPVLNCNILLVSLL